ncbi:MAG: hypothetical protein ACJA07_004356 [Rhodococcus sp. (in: high G+C Gram-positive bacteria)]|jgi:hypothetical protein
MQAGFNKAGLRPRFRMRRNSVPTIESSPPVFASKNYRARNADDGQRFGMRRGIGRLH